MTMTRASHAVRTITADDLVAQGTKTLAHRYQLNAWTQSTDCLDKISSSSESICVF